MQRLTYIVHMTHQYVPPVPASPLSNIPSDNDDDDDGPAPHANQGIAIRSGASTPLNGDPVPMSPMSLPYAESHASPGARSNASRAGSDAESETELVRVRSNASLGARNNASRAVVRGRSGASIASTVSSPRSNGMESPLQIRSAESERLTNPRFARSRASPTELVRVLSGASSAPVTPINRQNPRRHSSDYGPVRSISPRDRDNVLRREIQSSSSRSLSALADYHGISLPQSGIRSQSNSVLSSPVAAPSAVVRVSSALESSFARSRSALLQHAQQQASSPMAVHMSDQWTQPRSVHSSHSTSPLSQNPIFVSPNEALLRTPTSSSTFGASGCATAVSNRINVYDQVTPEMLMDSNELRQFEARLQLVHGTNTSTSATMQQRQALVSPMRQAYVAPMHAVRNLQGAFDQSSSSRYVHHVNTSDWVMPGIACTSSANMSHPLVLHSYGAPQPIQDPRPLLPSWPPVASSGTAVHYAASRQPATIGATATVASQQWQQQRSLVIEELSPSVQARSPIAPRVARPLLQSWPPQQQQFARAQVASDDVLRPTAGNVTATQMFDLME